MGDRVAVTGASGFIGRALVDQLAAAGRPLSLLDRRGGLALPQGARLVRGGLADTDALAELVRDVKVVIHLAATVKALSADEFHEINADGTARLTELAVRAGCERLVLVSSLAARAPALSAYAASKRAAETIALAHSGALEVVIVRPPAVYGPGDRATLPLFAMLERGILLVAGAPGARFSLLYVGDLAALLARLADGAAPAGQLLEPDDGTPGGYDWPGLAAIAAETLGRPVRTWRLPPGLLRPLAAGADRWARWRGRALIFGSGKLAELAHPDWVADRAAAPPPSLAWRPATRFAAGYPLTRAWYKEQRWL